VRALRPIIHRCVLLPCTHLGPLLPPLPFLREENPDSFVSKARDAAYFPTDWPEEASAPKTRPMIIDLVDPRLPACPNVAKLTSHIAYPSIFFVFVLLAILALFYALITYFKFNTVKVFKRYALHPNLWVSDHSDMMVWANLLLILSYTSAWNDY
jgi:hypothetical protein